jgi:hypothetical protein
MPLFETVTGFIVFAGQKSAKKIQSPFTFSHCLINAKGITFL